MKAGIITAAVLAAALMVGTSAAFASAGAPLAGEWTFDADQGTTVYDASGHDANGTLSGAVTRVAGFSGSGLSFDGNPGEVDVPDNPALEPAKSVTVAAWVESRSSPGPYRYIAVKGWDACRAGSYALYTGPNGGLQFYVGFRDKYRDFTRSPGFNLGASIWNGAWHLVVGSYDGSTVRLFVDGLAVGSGATDAGKLTYSLPGSNDFFIGDYPGCADRTFNGVIDDVRVWGSALSPAQVAALMPGPGETPNPVAGAPPDPSSGLAPGTPAVDPGPGTTIATGSPAGLEAADGQPVGIPQSDTPLLRPIVSRVRLALAQTSPQRHRRAMAEQRHSTISYRDTQAARSTLTIQRAAAGLRVQGRCVGGSRRSEHPQAPSCTRWLEVSSFTHADAIGENTLRRVLFPTPAPVAGRYRLQVTPVLGQLHGAGVVVGFRVGG